MTSCAEKASDDSGCTDNQIECSTDGIPQKCVNGQWEEQNKCASGMVCREGRCQQGGDAPCTTGARECSADSKPQICKNGKWMAGDPCNSEQKCMGGRCVPKDTPGCRENDVQCSDMNIPQVCKNGDWFNQPACANTEKCEGGTCVNNPNANLCKNNTRQCADGQPQVCINGVWTDDDECQDDEICEGGRCRSNANAGQDLCKNITCDKGRMCINGICVITAMLKAENKSVCQRTWVDEEYCDENGFKVSCAYTQTGILKISVPCSSGCVLSKIPKEEGFKTDIYRAMCMTESLKSNSAKCNENKDLKSIPFCAQSGTEKYIHSTYYCADTIIGDIDRVLIDLSKYNNFTVCSENCNSENTYCMSECSNNADCSNNKKGKACFYQTGVCGCDSDEDCLNSDYECIGGRCEMKQITTSCSVTECMETPEADYRGNACVDGYEEGEKMCGCETSLDCHDGYICNNFMGICRKANGICDYKDYELCDENELVTCTAGSETARQKCSAMPELKYRGDVCITEFRACGCKSDSDCRNDYTCDHDYGYCKPTTTTPSDNSHVESFMDHDEDASGNASGYPQTSYKSPITGITWTSEGFSWRHVTNGTDFSINKGGVLLKSNSSFTGKLSKGAAWVKAKVAQGSSGNKEKVIHIYLNDNECGSVEVNGKTGTDYLWLKCSASVAGNVELKITAPAAPVLIDDITWSDYAQ